MAETTLPPRADAPRLRWTPRWVALALLPLLLLAVILALIVITGGGLGDRATPPVERLNIQSVRLPRPGEITLQVTNDGPDTFTIAQIAVDDAYRPFTLTPARPLRRLESATVAIAYPWVPGEAHAISLISSTGLTFPAAVPVAVESPQATGGTVARFAMIGFYVGVIPVALGLLWYPFLRRLGSRVMRFILALTAGLLIFLVVDTLVEAQETAMGVSASLKARVLVPIVALLTLLLLLAIANRKPGVAPTPLAVSYRIALGIGVHNLGEGLAIGAAFALGEVALGVFLILGFTLHNVTEGVAIAAPVLRERPSLRHFALFALIAGGPAIPGVWIGGFVYSPLAATVFLAIGAGALVQVVIEVARILSRPEGQRRALIDWATLGGVAAGFVIMYATALLVAA